MFFSLAMACTASLAAYPEQYEKARQHYLEGQFEQARLILQELRSRHPEEAAVHLLYGHAAFAMDAMPAARQAYARAMELGRFDEAMLARLAHFESRRQRPGAALAALNLLMLVAADEDPYIVLAAAEIQAESGNMEQAEILFRQAIQAQPADPAAYLRMANLHIKQEQWLNALTNLTTAYLLGESSPEHERMIADLHIRAGHPEAAVQWYRRAIDNGVVDGRIMLHLAQAHLEAGQFAAARAAALRCVAMEEQSSSTVAAALWLLGQIERDQGDHEKAVGYWRRAAAIPGSPVRVHGYLAAAAFNQEKYQAAAAYYQAAYEAGDQSLETFRGLAISHFLNNNRAAAKLALLWLVEVYGTENAVFSELIQDFAR